MWNILSKKFIKNDFGLSRDDGLAVLKNKSGQQSKQLKKNIQKIFKEHGLDIIIQCNMKVVNYLNATFNLNDGTYKPYTKLYTKTQTIHHTSSGKFHYPQSQGYLPYHLTKKCFKKQYPLTKKHSEILAIDTHWPINILKTITAAPT